MAEKTFRELVTAAEKDPQQADFAALREAYVHSDEYNPAKHFSYHKLIGSTNSAGNFEEVVSFCEKMLEANPMDLEVRMMLEYAFEQLEWFEFAGRQHGFVEGMLGALFNSGDGKSIDTAWQVVAVAEEYTALSVMGLKMLSQELLMVDERYIDVMTVGPRAESDDPPKQLYFDITDPYEHLQNMIQGDENSDEE
jgi:hypothetical protein